MKAVDRHVQTFRGLQMDSGISAQHFRESKANLQRELRDLEGELNRDLARRMPHSLAFRSLTAAAWGFRGTSARAAATTVEE